MGFDYTSLATRRFKMPDDWRVVSIDDVAVLNELSIQPDYPHKSIEYIDIASAERGAVNSVQDLPLSDAPSRAKRIVRDNDTLVSTVRPNLEHYAHVKRAKPNTIASTGFAVVTAKNIDPRYLYYYLTTKPFTAYLSQIADSHTSAYPAINPDVIETAELLLPPASEQRAIAHILGTLDDNIELNRRMNGTLEAMAQALFKSWFVDFEPFRDEDMVESPLGLIPNKWQVGSVDQIAINERRGADPSTLDDDTPYIGLEHMPRGSIVLNTWEAAAKVTSNKFAFRHGEILFGKLRPYFKKVGVALTDGVCSTDILVIRPATTKWFSFLICQLSRQEFIDYTEAVSSGTKMPRVNWGDMAKYEVPLPSPAIADNFDQCIRPLINRMEANTMGSQTLAFIRDTLLPKLISGEIRVKDAEKFVEGAV